MTPHFNHTIDAGLSLPVLATAGAQPGWVVLNRAREQRFTGQIVFHKQPEVAVYFDYGIAYHAVSAGDRTLSEQLVAAGVVVPAQIERGTVRVGNVEHLGRLFDRDNSIDRDSVMVALELATDDAIAAIANRPATNFSVTAYRHHASGVHRWLVYAGPSVQFAPAAAVAQVVNPVATGFPDIADLQPVDDVSIEWDHPIEPDGQGAILLSVDDSQDALRDADEICVPSPPPVVPAPRRRTQGPSYLSLQ
jgi:hypothetical protein